MSQFHHYIPRFILRRWASEDPGPVSPGSPNTRNRRYSNRRRPDDCVNAYDIPSDKLAFGTARIGETYGAVDMYKDDSSADSDVYHVEQAFSALESNAARVLRRLEEALRRGQTFSLRRPELNTLRKFLFLLSYRKGTQSQQFHNDSFDDDTRDMIEEFRLHHGLRDVRAVWLFSMKHMLELEHWEIPYDERILYATRQDYLMDMVHKQLGFYSAPAGSDFLMTENGLGLADGDRGVVMSLVYPLTPKLVIILRNSVLTQETILVQQGLTSDQARLSLDGLHSRFIDLPKTMPDVTHNPPLDSESCSFLQKDEAQLSAEERRRKADFVQRYILDGRHIWSRDGDTLSFTVHALSCAQTDKVNNLLLDDCRETVCFLSPGTLARAIAAYVADNTSGGRSDRRTRFSSLKRQLTIAGSYAVPPSTTTSGLAGSG